MIGVRLNMYEASGSPSYYNLLLYGDRTRRAPDPSTPGQPSGLIYAVYERHPGLTGVIGGSGDRDHILDQGGLYGHALLSSRLSLRTRETGVIITWHVSRSTPKSRSAALTETRLFTRGSLSRTDWDVLYPRCVLHTATPSPQPLPRSVLLRGQGLAPTAPHPCSPSPSIQSA